MLNSSVSPDIELTDITESIVTSKRKFMQKGGPRKAVHKAKHQQRPGWELEMEPRPISYPLDYALGKLSGKTALITGGDSGIGRTVALLFAKEGSRTWSVFILTNMKMQNDVKRIVEGDFSRKCLLITADLSKEDACKKAAAIATEAFPKIDILVITRLLITKAEHLQI